MEAVRTSETSVDNHFTRQYIPEDNSEHHTRRRENLKSHVYSDIIRMIKSTCMRWAGHVARMGEMRDLSKNLLVKLEWKGPLGRSRRRWKDAIK